MQYFRFIHIVYLFLHGYGFLLHCLGGRLVSMQNFRFIVHIDYLFLHGCGLHYNVEYQ